MSNSTIIIPKSAVAEPKPNSNDAPTPRNAVQRKSLIQPPRTKVINKISKDSTPPAHTTTNDNGKTTDDKVVNDVTAEASDNSSKSLQAPVSQPQAVPSTTSISTAAPIANSAVNKNERQQQHQQNHQNRPKSIERGNRVLTSTKKMITSTSTIMSTTSGAGQKRVLENQFLMKKKRYQTLKNDIEDKHKSWESTYEELFQLREKILAAGGKDPGSLDELIPLPVWSSRGRTAGEAAVDGAASPNGGEGADAGNRLVIQLEAVLDRMTDVALNFCSEALDKRTNFITWLADIEQAVCKDPSSVNFTKEIAEQTEKFKLENAEYRERMATLKSERLKEISDLAQALNLTLKENRLLRKELSENATKLVASQEIEAINKELRAEKDKLQKARVKIRDQEQTITSLKQAQERSAQLEEQLRQKEAALEQKTKELARLHKQDNKSDRMKESLDAKIVRLKELELKEDEARLLVRDYKQLLQEREAELTSERQSTKELTTQLDDAKDRYAKLEVKCQQLLDMLNNRKDSPPDTNHKRTEFEQDLFKELTEHKKMVAEKDQLIEKLESERQLILAASNSQNHDDASQQHLAAELLSRSNEIDGLKNEIAQYQARNARLKKQNEKLEHILADMSQKGNLQQLQQQLSEARNNARDLADSNEELKRGYTLLQMRVEEYKRVFVKKDEENRVARETKQLLAQEKSDATFMDNSWQLGYGGLAEALEAKEVQIAKLEKLVKQMEKQEEYSQVQRTRLESRIAKLEIKLKKSEHVHRNMGFSFL